MPGGTAEYVEVLGIPEESIDLLETYLNKGGFHIGDELLFGALMIYVTEPDDSIPVSPNFRCERLPVGQLAPQHDGTFKAGYCHCRSGWAAPFHEMLSSIYVSFAERMEIEI